MNAIDQAVSVFIASKIAAIVNLFKLSFPETEEDLNPWLMDLQMMKFMDAHSLDLAFHFPYRSRSCRCSSILMQVRLCQSLEPEINQVIGIELAGFDYEGQQWKLSTIGMWQFIGQNIPSVEAAAKLEGICRQIFALFNDSVRPSAKEKGDR